MLRTVLSSSSSTRTAGEQHEQWAASPSGRCCPFSACWQTSWNMSAVDIFFQIELLKISTQPSPLPPFFLLSVFLNGILLFAIIICILLIFYVYFCCCFALLCFALRLLNFPSDPPSPLLPLSICPSLSPFPFLCFVFACPLFLTAVVRVFKSVKSNCGHCRHPVNSVCECDCVCCVCVSVCSRQW